MAAVVTEREFGASPGSTGAGAGARGPEPPVVLEARGLTRAYEARKVVDNVGLAVREGEVLAILGPNGAGKSTLFRLLSLLEAADEGEVWHWGRRVSPRDLQARRRLATVFQRPVLFQGKVRTNVAYGLRFRRVSRREARAKVAHALELVKIAHLADADVRTLSGGEAQRVALARALVLEPELLFLDEPTSNLDIDLRRRFREDLREVVGRLSTTVVLITHDQGEAFSLAQRVAVLRDGRIVQEGPATEVLTQPRDAFVADYLGAETIWRGEVIASDAGLCTVLTAEGLLVDLAAGAELGEEVLLAVRPEDVVVSLDSAHPDTSFSSARNHWKGSVDAVAQAGSLVRVHLLLDPLPGDDGSGERLTALITRLSAESLGLISGVRVTATVKATAIHLLEG
ncbi:MAG: ABC transporter ATP-binding protein [Thermoleophilia bacterium]|nr:ABC transporter ATP-binding protein [Thermoleophilia bacterium]